MMRGWSLPRLGTAAALAIWASSFWFIIATDRLAFYLASRATWLAPLGAATLTIAAIGSLATARGPRREPISKGQLANLLFLVVPAIVVMAFPPLTLGSFAVGQRQVSVKGAYASTEAIDIEKGDLSLMDIFGLSYLGDLDLLASRAGSTSSFTGFVSREGNVAADEFQLNRFVVSCCPGDAVLIWLRVVGAPAGEFKADDWVRVTGDIYPIGKTVVVDAAEVEKVPRPRHPYLNQDR